MHELRNPFLSQSDKLTEENRQTIDSLDAPDCERYSGVFINGRISFSGAIQNFKDSEGGVYSIARKQMEER